MCFLCFKALDSFFDIWVCFTFSFLCVSFSGHSSIFLVWTWYLFRFFLTGFLSCFLIASTPFLFGKGHLLFFSFFFPLPCFVFQTFVLSPFWVFVVALGRLFNSAFIGNKLHVLDSFLVLRCITVVLTWEFVLPLLFAWAFNVCPRKYLLYYLWIRVAPSICLGF